MIGLTTYLLVGGLLLAYMNAKVPVPHWKAAAMTIVFWPIVMAWLYVAIQNKRNGRD